MVDQSTKYRRRRRDELLRLREENKIIPALQKRVDELESTVNYLREENERLKRRLGIQH